MGNEQYWQELLSVLPESLHPVVKPHLEQMDKKVNEAFRNIHSQYEDYKQFKDHGIDAQYLVNAYNFTKNFEANPGAVLKEANEVYNLGFLDAEAAKAMAASNDDDDDEFEDDDDMRDLANHPQFKALYDAVNGLNSKLTEREQQELLEQQAAQHNEYLNELLGKDENKHVDRDFVTAVMSQGLTGEQAIERYNAALAQRFGDQIPPPVNNQTQQQTGQPPVVMGGNGGSGSGSPEQPIDFATMKGSDVNDLVVQMLQQSAQQNAQG